MTSQHRSDGRAIASTAYRIAAYARVRRVPARVAGSGPAGLSGGMPGAGPNTLRVRYVNANWSAAADGSEGKFQLLIVTEDDQRRTVAVRAVAVSALLGLVRDSRYCCGIPTPRRSSPPTSPENGSRSTGPAGTSEPVPGRWTGRVIRRLING